MAQQDGRLPSLDQLDHSAAGRVGVAVALRLLVAGPAAEPVAGSAAHVDDEAGPISGQEFSKKFSRLCEVLLGGLTSLGRAF